MPNLPMQFSHLHRIRVKQYYCPTPAADKYKAKDYPITPAPTIQNLIATFVYKF